MSLETVIDIDRHALYNALRMNWLLDDTIEVEPWQVINYREVPEDSLFEALQEGGIGVDSNTFLVFAEAVESPEELTDILLTNFDGEPSYQDQIYLIVFELWRRWIPEKLSFSIFCDELDHQISFYDQSESADLEHIEGALANLKMILDENVDSGVKAKEVFASVCCGCANDVESFLYDFIAEQVDDGNFSYAEEMLDDFAPYMDENKWFQLLLARFDLKDNPEEGSELLTALVNKALRHQDVEYNLEILAAMVRLGDCELFSKLAKKTLSLISREEELQDFLLTCIEFFRCRDCEQEQEALQQIFDLRSDFDFDAPISGRDKTLDRVKKVIS